MSTKLKMTEKQLQAVVLECAQVFHWRPYHTFDSRRSQAGFPDLVLVRERVMFVELKSETGKLSPEQLAWRVALQHAGSEYHLWRPADHLDGTIETVLR